MLAKPKDRMSLLPQDDLKEFDHRCRIGPEKVPDRLKGFISQKLWDSYSQIRRDSYKTMFTNPNSFFYRNRPPGDPQKFGQFTPEEEAQFIERLQYFREELNINDGMWGLFAVPLRGRLGYQCSNVYRQLLQEKKIGPGRDGMVKNWRQIPSNVHKRLEQEAFDFLRKCMASVESGEVKIEIPAEKEPDQEKRKPEVRKKKPDVVEAKPVAAKPVEKKEPKINELPGVKDRMSVLQFARDSVTGRPMACPYMDVRTGVVLDLNTWKKVLKGETEVAVHTRAAGLNDLIKMTQRNFNKHWMDIVNVSF